MSESKIDDRATAIGNMHKKFGEHWTCRSEDMIAYKHTHTDRHAHHNTPLPYRGGVTRRRGGRRLDKSIVQGVPGAEPAMHNCFNCFLFSLLKDLPKPKFTANACDGSASFHAAATTI